MKRAVACLSFVAACAQAEPPGPEPDALDELEAPRFESRVADRIAFLDGGLLRFDETLESLKSSVYRIEAVYDDAPPDRIPLDEVWDRRTDGRMLTLTARGEAEALKAALQSTGARDVAIDTLPLEDILVDRLKAHDASKEAAHV